jgi:hypothetical protein
MLCETTDMRRSPGCGPYPAAAGRESSMSRSLTQSSQKEDTWPELVAEPCVGHPHCGQSRG